MKMTYQALQFNSERQRPVNKGGCGHVYFHFTKREAGNARGAAWPVGYCFHKDCRHRSPTEAAECFRSYCKKHNEGYLPDGRVVYGLSPVDMLVFTV